MNRPGQKKIAYVNLALILLNVLYFLYLEIVGSSEDLILMVEKGAMFEPYITESRQYYRFLTAMFMHFGIEHLVNNMLVLYVLGDHLEREIGKIKYIILYLLCGIGANMVSFIVNLYQDKAVVSAGASGAVFGVIGALIYVVTVNRGRLEDLTTQRLVLMVLFSVYFSISKTNIDHIAHASGIVIGVFIALILYRKPNHKFGVMGEVKDRW